MSNYSGLLIGVHSNSLNEAVKHDKELVHVFFECSKMKECLVLAMPATDASVLSMLNPETVRVSYEDRGDGAFVAFTQVLGIPLWWVFRNIALLSTVQPESRFDMTINPEAPTNIGDSVLITVLNASDQMPVEGAKVSLKKDGDYIFDYYTNASGQVLVEYVGEITVIEVSKTDFKTVLEAIPHAPAKWVRDQSTSMVIGIVSAVAGSVTTYILQNKRKRSQ